MEAPETQQETATLDDNPVSNGTNGAAEVADVPDSAGLLEDDVPVREERVVVKFLVPNVAAGSIIGKGGANITEIQTQSSARMQLSKSNEFYPLNNDDGGQDRILLISGTVNQLLTALHLVLSKLKSEPGALRAVQAKESAELLQLRMLVHSRLCGTLIGKGGATIRSFNEDSKATFNISSPPTVPGLQERVVRMTGDIDQLMRAVALVVTKLSENPDYHLLTDANLSYSHRGFLPGGGPYPPPQGMGGAAGGPQGAPAQSVTMPVPEDKVGVVIGKQGQVIKQIKEMLGVNIRISAKGEFMAGTSDRVCTISGSQESVEIAQRIIKQKIEGRL
ncbi:hypothetical protein N2152v2_009074 [Parachlorella kessleri]